MFLRFAALTLLLALLETAAAAGVVAPVPGAPAVLIPVAGNAPGAYGTYFRSDVTIANLRAADQRVALQWLPQGAGATMAPIEITIAAQSSLRSDDFVQEYLHTSGVGAIIVTGLTPGGAPDPAAALFVTSRVWTAQGSRGQTSQPFDTLPLPTVVTKSAAIYGMGALAGSFRINVGVINVDPVNEQTFLIEIPSFFGAPPPGPITIAVPPMSMRQVAVANPAAVGAFGSPFIVTNTTPISTRSDLWTAYGSTIDNGTGDAFGELAINRRTP